VTFSSSSCTLSSGSCSVTATGSTVGSGSVTVTGSYGGDANNSPSSGAFLLAIHTTPAVSHVPVGGVMLPSVGFTVLLPWVIALSLLGVLSVEAFTIKRRAKRR
jgi:hypothetical protein